MKQNAAPGASGRTPDADLLDRLGAAARTKLQIFSSTDATNSRSGPPTSSAEILSACIHAGRTHEKDDGVGLRVPIEREVKRWCASHR